MAGHSHWANIAHKKALIDNKRGKLWSKLSKAIIVAAKTGGGDLDMNLKLRYAIDAAKAVSVPKDNIQRAIKKRHRRAGGRQPRRSALRRLRRRRRGRAVRNPDRQPQPHGRRNSQDLRAGRRQAGRHRLRRLDVRAQGAVPGPGRQDRRRHAAGISPWKPAPTTSSGSTTSSKSPATPASSPKSARALQPRASQPEVSEITRIPNSTIDLDAETARKVLKLMEKLDDHDDVQSVSANFNIPQEAMAEIEG